MCIRDRRTFYNFQKRLANHHKRTKENLFEKVFAHLTKKQLAALAVDASIQRVDSVLLNSNIRSYSRLALLIEMLRRLYLILNEQEQQTYQLQFQPYLKGGEKYIYELKIGQGAGELATLASVYYLAYEAFKIKYAEHAFFQAFARVYHEHFKVLSNNSAQKEEVSLQVVPRSKEELDANTLQSPDDVEATFRKKQKETYHGFVALGAETCHPENDINLVTVLSADTNNTDDSNLLAPKLDSLIEQCPDLSELHQDGGFGSKKIDAIAKENKITIIQTAVRGKTAAVPIRIEGEEEKGLSLIHI